MPQDDQSSQPGDPGARVAAIRADLAYFKEACRLSQLGHQPPTVYAAKYAEDVEFLLSLMGPVTEPVPATPPPPDSTEGALAMDEAVRVERKKR